MLLILLKNNFTMIKIISVVLLIFAISACTSVKVVNVNEAEKYYDGGIIYSLPETVLQIDVELKKTTYIRGPFFEYAEKYLNINNVIKKNHTEWEIINVDINSIAEPDYNNYFVLKSNNKTIMNGLTLNEKGVIESINLVSKSPKSVESDNLIIDIAKPEIEAQFTDLSIKRNINELQDTVYKKVKQDTSFVRVPIIRKQLEKKSINEKAEEAANFIIKLRKRRFKVLTAQTETQISGTGSVQSMIAELDKLEEEYLSLFIGKKYEETIIKNFTYTPNKSKDLNVSILFNLSKENGIVSKEDQSSQQVIVKVINDGKTKVIDSYLAKKEEEKTKEIKGLVYRIPDLASVQVLLGEDVIARKKLLVAQFGTLTTLPETILKNKNVQIRFNPLFGNIEQIFQ
ncbi:MAG TPA: hypothetical protein DDX39_04360 [Bacteroidales bacterium]|nr:MAG: hypothetical protein A2W98_10640 [Bacteroidetes bacterium GWF2_33_38]OFY75495.1 MAG: hypothetical protein A2265_03405 [Bacteroidetes bacterium RIFOXYA12_FULL_33_9]HBF87856.1 hypothetical protein [Bacteroidales bacterium]